MLKKSGFLVSAFVTKSAHLRDLVQKDPERLLSENEFYAQYLKTGQYTRNPSVVSYHTHPAGIRGLFEKVENPRLALLRMVGCEGFLGGGLSKNLNGLSEDAFEAWVAVVWENAEDPTVLSSSDHIVVVAKRT